MSCFLSLDGDFHFLGVYEVGKMFVCFWDILETIFMSVRRPSLLFRVWEPQDTDSSSVLAAILSHSREFLIDDRGLVLVQRPVNEIGVVDCPVGRQEEVWGHVHLGRGRGGPPSLAPWVSRGIWSEGPVSLDSVICHCPGLSSCTKLNLFIIRIWMHFYKIPFCSIVWYLVQVCH